jgi:hypothetical protein
MLHQIAALTLIATLGPLAHHHCPNEYRNPLCVPAGLLRSWPTVVLAG